MEGWVWMRIYMEGMLKYWNAIYYGGLSGWSGGEEEVDSTGIG